MKTSYQNKLTIDVPAQFNTSIKGSFARDIIQNIYPNLLNNILENNILSKNKMDKLTEFYDEITRGKVKKPQEDNTLSHQWNNIQDIYNKKTWLELPSYWAESYFFYRLGEIFEYTLKKGSFEDPFFVKKDLELEDFKITPLLTKCESILKALDIDNKKDIITKGFLLSLVGNRADLSHSISNYRNTVEINEKTILSNNLELIIDTFLKKESNSLIFVVDNSGEELIFDLLLSIILLKYKVFNKISIHLKPYPFFVSDATLSDVQHLFTKIPNTSLFKKLLKEYTNRGLLTFEADYFYTSPYFMYEMPKNLWDKFEKASCAIYKGDLNYRRLLGDAKWDTNIDFEYITDYFPTSLIALRVMKSDIAVGIPDPIVSTLVDTNSSWKSNGKYSVIQTHFKREDNE